ncbi:MAG: hypothetical protein ACLGHN_01230 [Bacteriovoracia bacterium]
MRNIFLLFLLFILSSCAAKKLLVENADTLLTHQVTKRLPLYSKQKDNLNKDVDQFLNKAKPVAQEVLPVIDEIDLNSPDKVEKQYNKLEEYYIGLTQDFTAMLSKYMALLDKKQQKDFFETLDDENRELLKTEKEKRLDKIEDRFKLFFGSMKNSQKQLLRDYSDYFHLRAKERLERRVKLHGELRAIFGEELSQEARSRSIEEAFSRYQKDALKGNKNLEMLKKLLPTISSSQKEHFRNRVKEVKEMLNHFIISEY